MTQPETKLFSLPIRCDQCRGAVVLHLEDWLPRLERDPLRLQAWGCPHCFAKNEGGFPGRLAWAMKRPGTESQRRSRLKRARG